jgi:hypothetical protein
MSSVVRQHINRQPQLNVPVPLQLPRATEGPETNGRTNASDEPLKLFWSQEDLKNELIVTQYLAQFVSCVNTGTIRGPPSQNRTRM